MELHGGCLCGGTRYVLHADPTRLCECHCIDCRRASGATSVAWGSVPRNQLEVTKGTLRRIPFAQRIRAFAACCGTQLFFEESPAAELIDFTIASLDDPSPYAPKKIIWTEDRLPWVVVDPNLPSFPKGSS